MSDEKNPYAPPAAPSEPPPPAPLPKEARLSWAFYAFLGLQLVANVVGAFMFFFMAERMRAIDPHGPQWSFPTRGVLSLSIVTACALLLARRRVGLHVYYAISAASLPLNVARGVTSIPGLVGGAIGAPLIVWLLTRKKMASFR